VRGALSSAEAPGTPGASLAVALEEDPMQDADLANSNPGLDGDLSGMTIALLATDGFEQDELVESRIALGRAGAKVVVIAPSPGRILGLQRVEKAGSVEVDLTLDRARAEDFDALVVPGGALSPDSLRAVGKAVALVREFAREGKPIGALSQGPATLVEAGLVRGRKVTSWPTLKTDLENAGAHWVDRDAVVDHGLVTGRTVPAFVAAAIGEFSRRRAGAR
jgi:protease I